MRAGQAEAAGRRVAVGGVADEVDAALGVAIGHHGLDRPARDLVDLQRQVGDSERRAHVSFDLLVGLRARIVDRVVDVDHPLLGRRPPAVGPHRDHHDPAAGLRGEHPADQDVVVRRDLREVSRDVHRRRLGHVAEALVLDPEQRGHGAPAVGPDRGSATGRCTASPPRGRGPSPSRRRRPARARSARGRSGPGPERALGVRLDQRLQPDLRKVQLMPCARGAPLLVHATGAPALDARDAPPVVRGRAR